MASRDIPSTDDELDPQNVAIAFAQQYYHFIHKSPELVYKFYKDQSVLDRLGSDGEMTSVVTRQGINDKIMSSDYKGCSFQTTNVDGQRSLMGGILVAVHGYFIGQDNQKSIFYQTFFLAKQETGYFVLNDILRFAEGLESKALPTCNDIEENASDVLPLTRDQETPDVQAQSKEVIESVEEVSVLDSGKRADSVGKTLDDESGKRADSVGKTLDDESGKRAGSVGTGKRADNDEKPSDDGMTELGAESEEKASDIDSGKKEALDAKVMVAAVPDPSINEGESAASNEKPKPSYASMVAKQSKVASPKHNTGDRIVRVAPNAGVKRELAPSNAAAGTYNVHPEAPGAKSIYIANLPPNITKSGVVDALNTFGRIRPGGIQIKTFQDGFCFAFVDFELASSASKAVEVHNITVEGYGAKITYKKSNSRSGFTSGVTGGAFRNDNPRIQENMEIRSNSSYKDNKQAQGTGGQNGGTNQKKNI